MGKRVHKSLWRQHSQLRRVDSELDREELIRRHLAESDRVEVAQLRRWRGLVLRLLRRALRCSLHHSSDLLADVGDELLV